MLGLTHRCSDKVYIAPSGVQKERIRPEHIFVLPFPQPSLSVKASKHTPALPQPLPPLSTILDQTQTRTETQIEAPANHPHHPFEFLRRPGGRHAGLKQSACTPLFWNAFELRGAASCVHTHSQHAVMATLLWPGKEFRVSHQVCYGVQIWAAC